MTAAIEVIKIDPSNNIAANLLVQLFAKTPYYNCSEYSQVTLNEEDEEILYEVLTTHQETLAPLLNILEQNNNETTSIIALDLIKKIIKDKEDNDQVIAILNKLLELSKDNSYLYCNVILVIGSYPSQAERAIDLFVPILTNYERNNYNQGIERIVRYLGEIGVNHSKAIDILLYVLEKYGANYTVLESLKNIGVGSDKVVKVLLQNLIDKFQEGNTNQYKRLINSLRAIIGKEHFKVVVTTLSPYFTNPISNEIFMAIDKLLWYCAEHMTYPEFYKAWHSQPEIIHPEILEIPPLGNTASAQTLNQQILDLSSQFQPTEKTYPLIINAQSLEDETDNSSIAQEICNQIYAIAFPDETNIPEINNFSKLKREIPKIKKQLNTQNLALIFHKGEPNESLNIFCKQLATDTHIHIRWITKQKMEYINGILPQENLVNILQNWINQLD
jgi:hypothetical protein